MSRRKKLKIKNFADLSFPLTMAYAISKGLATAIEEGFEIPKEFIELFNKSKRIMINIEICKSPNKPGAWNMRIGDIEGSVDVYNMDKKDILELISCEMK